MKDWHLKWQDEYLGSDHERAVFFVWSEDNDETMDDFRQTGAWTDAFLDWAWEQEKNSREESNEIGD